MIVSDAEDPIESIIVTIYCPGRGGKTNGFCKVSAKPSGPVHDQETASPADSNNFKVSDRQTGPFEEAETSGFE